jgi:hypothetical protein
VGFWRELLTLSRTGKNGAFAHADSELLHQQMHAAYYIPGARRRAPTECAQRCYVRMPPLATVRRR